MNKFILSIGLVVLSIFPGTLLGGVHSRRENTDHVWMNPFSQVVMVPGLLSERLRRPLVSPSTVRLVSETIGDDRYLNSWSSNLEDSLDTGSPRGVRIAKSIGFGLLAGGAGFGLGTLAVQITTHPHGEDAGLALLAGGAIGAPLLFPVGVHLGNESRGNLALDYLPLAATGLGAVLLSGKAHDASPFIILGIVDIVGTIVVEQLVGD